MNKTIILLGTFLIYIFICGCTSIQQSENSTFNSSSQNEMLTLNPTLSDQPPHWIPEPISLNASYPQFPEKMIVYSVIPDEMDTKIGDLKNDFNISGRLDIFQIPGFSREIDVVEDNNGSRRGLVMRIDSGFYRYYVNRFVPEGCSILNYQQAQEFAKSYLKNKGLLTDDALFDHISHSEETLNENNTSIYRSYGVWFNRKINGTISNDYVYLELSCSGEILSYEEFWKKIEPLKEYPLISPDEAYQKILTTDRWGKITNVSLEYYSGSRHDITNYILPAFVFRGVRSSYCSGTEPFEYYIIAAKFHNESGTVIDVGPEYRCS
jgi:hypothetical protein